MDDYMREMMDLKTLVTKTLEKKGVLARIRAELRANVFAAIEEQDRASEGEDGPLALLGTCNERAKKLHATATGKLLSSLVYEYLEWCDLEHTAKVYLPECNLSRGQSRAELEVKLGFKQEGEETGNDAESRPLLLEVLESFLKTGRPAARSSTPVSARSRTVSVLSKGGSEDEDALRELEKQGGNPRESAFDSNPLPGVIRSANRLSPSGEPASLNEPLKDTEKISGRTATNLIGNLPPLRRSGGLTPIGTSRGNPSSLTSSNSSESAASAASRDRTTTSSTRKEELNQTSLDKPGGLRNSEQIRVGKDGGTTEKQSQSRFVAPSDVSGTRDPAYHDDDSASEDNSGKPINASHQQALRRQDLSSVEGGEGRGLSSSSAVRKKATAYVYSDSEDDVSLEVVEEDLIEDVDVPRENISSTK